MTVTIPNKVNDTMRLQLDNSRRGKGTRKQDLGKPAGKFHTNVHNYGRNRLVFRKLQSVVSSVLIRVNDLRPSTLSDRNTGASWNLTDLIFHLWRAGLVCWLRPKVVLGIYSAVVEMLSCWIVGWTWHWHLRWRKTFDEWAVEQQLLTIAAMHCLEAQQRLT